MSKEFQIRDGNLIASFDLENEDGDIDFCKLLKVSHGVADEIGMFVDYVATNKIIKDQSKQIADLEAKLAESKKKNFELVAKIKLKEHTPAFCTLADRDCEALGKIAELQKQLAEKDKAIENWQTIYESVVQTCHNDKEEIERLNKKLETQENIITNLVEDNRASQEWYRKQLEEKDKEIEYQESMKILAVENQNKKAIEQLEKVKSAFGLINSKLDKVETIKEYIHYIDHQINELKGKVE